MDRSLPIQRGRPVSGLEAAHANEYFEQFLNASSLKHILGYYRGLIDYLHLKPNAFQSFYPKLRANLTSWKAKALWKKFDARATHKCYLKGKAATNTKVLIIGGGPCGMRTAIEAQLLGAKVVVIEKRDRFSRNNVLHLWPFVIEDLRMLGAKKFFGKFCAGAIDHISIRRLQCILLKVALLLGVEVHTEVSFEKLIEPNATEKTGWRAEVKPSDHPVSQYEFDVIIGADGKRNTLQGFTRKEFRGKLAIAITANFINKKTEAEARVEEISGVAFIFNQKFFKDLLEVTRIDLENIVYYKDDTHYFVMTAKKASLIEKGVIKQDLADTEKLLAPENVDREALEAYAIEAANFSTNYQMPDLEFAVNHYGQPDIAMFDFTSMFAADNASKVVERNGYRLLMILVGDSLLEPFWPTGSGCARGFLSSLDAAWAIRSWSLGTLTPLDVLAERESIYRLLAQTTPDNLNKDWKSYSLEPSTRYPNLNKAVIMPHQTVGLYDTDNPASIDRMKRNAQERPNEVPKKRRRGNVDNEVLLNWISEQLRNHEDITVTDIGSIFKDGKILCAIIHHYRPDLLDYNTIKDEDPAKNNQLAFDILEKELGIPPIMTGEEITNTEDFLTMATYLTQVYDTFRGEIPHIKQPKLELPESNKRSELSFKTIKTSNFQPVVPTQPSRPSSRHKRHADAMITNKAPSLERKTRKRRTLEKIGASVEERQKMLEEIASNRAERHNRRRQQRKLQTEQFVKSMQMLQANSRDSEPFEDYSIFLYRQTAPKFEDRVKDLEKQFTYIPDHENKMPNLTSRTGGADEDLAARIKNFESKLQEQQPIEKKPKDLLRAIGKIETSDWNIKEIEKKIKENKMGKPSKVYDKEKVPKWSKEQFLARQTKMEKQHLDRQDSAEAKYANIDKNIKDLDLKLKEGNIRELGRNKVATITEKLVSKVPQETKPVEKTNNRPVVLPAQGGSEFCHFCGKRVYLMERLSAEGRFFHHGCFKCQYCNTQLRLGSYAFDRDGLYDNKFFCIHHFGMVGELPVTKVIKKPTLRQPGRSPEKKPELTGLDLLDRVETPERAEFANLSTGNASSDQEESINQMDEDEWTDKNFGASCAEMEDSEDESSSLSDTDSEDEDAFDDALEEPVTKEGTMKWADRWKNSYSKKRRDSDSNGYSSSDQSSYYENSSDDDDSETATEGEEEIRARELRKQEVRVEPPIVQTDTGTDTEVVSDETSSESSSEIQNSATEISTDSEFAHDDPTPTREIPAIILNDFNVTKTRGSGGTAKRIQVTSGYLQRPTNERIKKPDIELKLKPLVPSAPSIKKPAHILLPRTEGYALNRTQSTGGIAAKVSLELKKKYLLGENAPGSIQKSGSASTLDSKFKTFHTAISDCQKLLKPAKEISASMQTFCNKLDECHSPVLSPQSSMINLDNVKKEESTKEKQPPPDVTNVTSHNTSDNKVPEAEPYVFQNESEGRPRSPVHETSIIVPEIDWSKKNRSQSSDSLCTSSSDNNEHVTTSNNQFENIPRVEVHEAHDDDDDIPPDSLCIVETNMEKPVQTDNNYSLHSEPSKSITSEKKTLNQPKSLPDLESMLPDIHKSLHVNHSREKVSPEVDSISIRNSSGLSSPDSGAEQATTALTETELSDWARDGAVSDDFEDAEFEFNREPEKPYRKNKDPTIAKMPELDHICGKEKQMKDFRNKTIITETMNSILSANLDNIEFMDTGTETSSDDGVGNSQEGYVLFKNEDDFAEDSLNPNINDIVEATNVHVDEKYEPKNTGYCILATEDKPFDAVINLKSSDLEKLKQRQTLAEHEEDSLLIVETGTTTEENTCSDSTVKNITEISVDKVQPLVENRTENNSLHKQKLEEKLAKVKEEMALKGRDLKEKRFDQGESIADNNIEFEEHCQRLQSKVEFGNVKDSIDIRKSRRKSKSESPQKPDLIQEEKLTPVQSPNSYAPNLTSTPKTPDILYKKEILQKERDVNQRLIQEMVMNKMKAEHKSLERKKRNRQISPSLNTSSPFNLTKSATTDVSQINKDNFNRSSIYSTGSSTYTTPDVLLTTNLIPLQNSQSVNTISDMNSSADIFSTPLSSIKEQNNRPLSVYSYITEKKIDEVKPSQPLRNSENCSMPDIRKNLFSDDFVTPKAPPRLHRLNDETNKADKLKQDARARAKLLSNEELGLSPEEKLLKLRDKISKRGKENEIANPHIQESIESLVVNTERRNSFLHSNDSLNKKKNNSFKRSKSSECAEQTSNLKLLSSKNNVEYNRGIPVRTKSVSEFPKTFSAAQSADKQMEAKKICKSDPNLLDTIYVKPKKKSKDRERRKSITKLISTLFTKKSPSSNSKSLFSKLSPKSKDLSKQTVTEEPVRRRSLSEIERVATTPPPIPPLPVNYTIKDESSEGEHDCKNQGHSSCDTLDKSGVLENSTSSLTGRKTGKSARKLVRQAQLKRHRMAQEIQRKLEETEVKTRELETRGVLVEKALRGEDSKECHRDESELLQEWFDLMRDRTELRRYEKELMIRAQELELEDRHARLQHELRERLENNEQKTEADVKVEESIINEMMEIVSKRDSLIAVIEEDRLRYSTEDRDFEEQMLAKGLRLTSIQKPSEK
ncbi:F-actin-monooxygenase Mical isoform X2 [Anoplophora glabripennis]|uniref:F-actin-monooxygenase Mical isoform X2 n=1 Tax=Anoplophora glabripennis TaxID=217634 RepID=UPI00087368AD|nr:F-actin-monooxygenase Mical isoform X2 [Anoplophora glabripennis]